MCVCTTSLLCGRITNEASERKQVHRVIGHVPACKPAPRSWKEIPNNCATPCVYMLVKLSVCLLAHKYCLPFYHLKCTTQKHVCYCIVIICIIQNIAFFFLTKTFRKDHIFKSLNVHITWIARLFLLHVTPCVKVSLAYEMQMHNICIYQYTLCLTAKLCDLNRWASNNLRLWLFCT